MLIVQLSLNMVLPLDFLWEEESGKVAPSPCIFFLMTQLLSDFIKKSNLKWISVANRNIVISQWADDTTLFLWGSNQIPFVISIINTFSVASGLYLNINKCELMAITDYAFSLICNIPVKNSVTYLGITITKDQ